MRVKNLPAIAGEVRCQNFGMVIIQTEDAMRRTICLAVVLLLLVGSSIAVFAKGGGPPDAPPPPPELSPVGLGAKAHYTTTIQTAKEKLDETVRAARTAYFKSVLADDDQYIAALNAATKSAMQNGDLKAAELLDDQKKDAVAARQAHFNVAFQAERPRIVEAIRTVNGPYYGPTQAPKTVTTNFIRAIVASGLRNVTLWPAVFGETGQRNYVEKTTINVSLSGATKTIDLADNSNLPDELFGKTLPFDDPAWDEYIH